LSIISRIEILMMARVVEHNPDVCGLAEPGLDNPYPGCRPVYCKTTADDPYRTISPAERPRAIRKVLVSARRRYHCARLVERPDLGDARSYVGLFALDELITLAKCGHWPLSEKEIGFIRESPEDRARRRQRKRERVEALVPLMVNVALAVVRRAAGA
jgi:hypothetical protein